MDGRMVMVALCLASAPLQAQHVFKCVEDGAVSYQSAPCSAGAAERTWEAVPESGPSPADRERMAGIEQELARRNARAPAPAPNARVSRQPRPAGSGQCETVKGQRDAAYRRVGLKRTFAFSSQWDARVQQACR